MRAFIQNDLTEPAHFENADQLHGIIKDVDDKNLVHAAIAAMATELNSNHGGAVPTEKEMLVAMCKDDTVACLMMSHCFGSTEIVIGLHARKILTALDLYDWEEAGFKAKTEVKMTKIPAGHIMKSLRTWIPKGEGRDFYDTMDSLGTLLAVSRQGQWGYIKQAFGRFSPNNKRLVEGMVDSIIQFYKVTKGGAKMKATP